MSQQDKPRRECITHHFACDCREEKFQKLEAALKDADAALEYYEAGKCVFITGEVNTEKASSAREQIKKVIG